MEQKKKESNYWKYHDSYVAYRKKDTTKEMRKKYRDKYMFNGMKEQALKRDNYTCVLCGMSNEEHLKKWGKELTVDHIDGKGRNSDVKNNRLNNLRSLCLPCHGRQDIIRRSWRKVRSVLSTEQEKTEDRNIFDGRFRDMFKTLDIRMDCKWVQEIYKWHVQDRSSKIKEALESIRQSMGSSETDDLMMFKSELRKQLEALILIHSKESQ